MLPGPARLSLDALARLVRAEQIGELPDVLAPPAVWQPSADEDAAEDRAKAEIARLGWRDRRGRLEPEVAASLAVLCRATAEFSGWIGGGTGVLAAASGRVAVLAVATGQQVTLKRAPRKRLPEALVAQLPDVPPGQGTAVSVPLEEMRQAAKWRGQEEGVVTARPLPRGDLRQALHVSELPVLDSGELWVAVRDGLGRRRRIPYPLCYADTESGRYFTVATVSDNGDVWVLVAPAAPAALVAKLRELHQSL
ncbi:ESX secretion-associated protein EspG [Kibdelosporangium persicum]|uniref:ESX secretion-associated protein EspG n=1 Tax=Kibdelosporangium persicum TaxID=2698649 RepID=A0ABX2F0M4_9PSEU|nr:ESX secretion-associated protein EspG [Kibdelosporangium persicum]NRN64440.1 ESX secretion-associated protein EspG [Kibdelosporangium persicum]